MNASRAIQRLREVIRGRNCNGCVPIEEAGEDLLTSIRKNFGAVYQVGMKLAETALKEKKITDFNFCYVAGPSYEDHHNKQCAIKWEDLTAYIEEYALGRKLTKAELKRFVEKNVLTIQRQNRKSRKRR